MAAAAGHPAAMGKNRLEAFSDGVIAIIITIMVLEMKVPLSPIVYVCAIVATFFWSWVAQILYIAVALVWLIPDRRIENSVR